MVDAISTLRLLANLRIFFCLVESNFLLLDVFVKRDVVVVNNPSLNFDDTVGDCLNEFVVMGSEDDIPFKSFNTFVDGANAFEIKVTGWTV